MQVFNHLETNQTQASGLSKMQRLLCFLLLVPCLFFDKSINNDTWFILNSGRYVLQYGIPYTEPFTIHNGLSFVMQQWLSAVIFWKAYVVVGEIGLKIMVFLTYILIIYICFKLCMLLSEKNFFVSFAISLLSGALIIPFMTERPYIFMFLIILLEIYELEKYIKFQKCKYLLALPVLSLLLVNLEAAMWPLLFVILIPYLIDSFRFRYQSIESQGYSTKNLIFTTIGMLAAGFINPYGLKAMTYLFTSYGIDEINSWITEMQCADINSFFGKIIFSTILIVLISFIVYRKGNYRIRFYLLALGTIYMTLSSVRSFPLFIMCGVTPMSYYFKDVKIEQKNDERTLKIRKVLIFYLVTVLLVGSLIIYNKEPEITRQQNIMSSVEYLEKLDDKNIRLYTGYNDGGYLEFRGFKVYIDPRADVFLKSNNNKDDIFIECYKLEHGEIFYKEVLLKYDFDFLLVSDNEILYNYLDYDSDYRLAFSSNHYKIFESLK